MNYWLRHLLQHAAPGEAGGGAPATPPEPAPGSGEGDLVESDDSVLDAFLDGPAGGEPAPKVEGATAPVAPSAPPAAAPTPTPAPATPPVGPPSAAPVIEPPPPTPTPPTLPPTPTPIAAPVAAPQLRAVPAPVVATAPPVPIPPPTPAPAALARTESEIATERTAARAKYESDLEKLYQIPVEDVDTLLTSPEKVLPKLVARARVDVEEAVIAAIMGNLPRFLETHSSQQTVIQEQQRQYFAMWPILNDAAGHKVTERLLASWRPELGATSESIMREVGIAAMTILQRPIQAPAAGGQPPAPPATPPAAPFQPAGPGGASGIPGGRPQLDLWESLADELIQEDRQ